MAATKVNTGAPGSLEYCVQDVQPAGNGYAQGYPNTAGGSGYDDFPYGDNGNTALPASQGKNAIAGANGNVLVDQTNDYVPALPRISTVSGNPTQNVATAPALSTLVLNTQVVRLVFKNPA